MSVVDNVIVRMVSAGIEDEQLLNWLASCRDGDEAVLPDLNETALITNESLWHLNHLHRTAEGHCERCGDPALQQQAEKIMAQLGDAIARLRDLPKE